MLALPAKTLILIPVVVDANCPQVEDSLGTRLCPTHAGLLHPILDQVTASALGDTGADRPTLSQILVVVHIGRVAPVIADSGVQGLALRGGERRVPSPAFQGVNDVGGSAGQDVQ